MTRLYPILLLLLSIGLQAQTYRYTETIFPGSVKTANVVYGTAPFLQNSSSNESNTQIEDLVMDIYQPTGDTETNRPAVIFAHSGAFISGNRNHDDMVAFCDSLARKGYVTATIDYRKGFNFILNTDLHSTRAVYRGIQDGRTAVRFLRANAATYGIDPDKIYLAGSSAGGFIALHSVYMTDPAEKPTFAGTVSYTNFSGLQTGPDLGPVDIGDNLGFDGTPDAIISMWGALETADLVSTGDTEPALLIHGTADGTVPFNSGSPFGVALLPSVEGSNLINNELTALGMTDTETYFVSGAGHEFHGTSNGTWDNGTGGNAEWEVIVSMSTDFLWKRHKPTASFGFAANQLNVSFSDSSTDALSWIWDFGDGTTSMAQNPAHSFSAPGTYEVSLYVENANRSWDEIAQTITVSTALPVLWAEHLRVEANNDRAELQWGVHQQVNNEKFVVEHSLNGHQFDALAELPGSANSSELSIYEYTHQGVEPGMHYYRIAQHDFDGSVDRSNLVAIWIQPQERTLEVFPNPATETCTILRVSDAPAVLELYSMQGRLLAKYAVEGYRATLELPELPTGAYFLRGRENGEVTRLQVVR